MLNEWGRLFYSNKIVYFPPVKILDNRFTFEGSILSGFPTFCLMSPMLAPAGISCGLNKKTIIFVCSPSNHMSLVMRKPAFCICKNKDNQKLISAFIFATRIVQSLFFLNPKFQASRHILWLCSPVCVAPARKPRRPVFSQRGSYVVRTLKIALVM